MPGFTKFLWQRRNKMNSGRSSQITPSCKCPVLLTYTLKNYWKQNWKASFFLIIIIVVITIDIAFFVIIVIIVITVFIIINIIIIIVVRVKVSQVSKLAKIIVNLEVSSSSCVLLLAVIKFQCQATQGGQAAYWHHFWPG